MINKKINWLLLPTMLLNAGLANAADYYVSSSGSDNSAGTLAAPFATVQHATSVLNAGDTLYIRGGTYREVIDITGLIGTNTNPITINAYQDEVVRFDGTKDIDDISTGTWSLATTEFPGSSNIYKITLTEDVWQLFVDDKYQVPARWPNASTTPDDLVQLKSNGYEAADNTWWSKTTWANADKAGTTQYTNIENDPNQHDLAGTGISFAGGTVIYSFLSQGGDGNQEREISTHTAGSNLLTHPTYTGPGTKKGYTSTGKYFIIEHLDALDQAKEWHYLPASKTLFLWAENGVNPSSLNVHGRVVSRSLIGTGEYVTIKGINFFAGTFDITGPNLTIDSCRFTFPDATKRMLGQYAADSDAAMQSYGSLIDGANFEMVNSIYEYAEMGIVLEKGSAPETPNSVNAKFTNNLFQYVGLVGMGKNSLVQFAPTFTRNTVRHSSPRGLFKSTVNGDSSVRNQSFNRLQNWGYLQVHDGSGLQVAQDYTQQTQRTHNWFLYAAKYGSRWDGKPANFYGTNHHSVGMKVRGAFQVKGDSHETYNNTAFNGFDDKNDIIVVSDITYGGNGTSITKNNVADTMAGERTGDTTQYPMPGTHSHNWNGYEETGKAEDLLVDPANLDFRPKAGSALVDAGTIISGITDGYVGSAPDIGAYEYGDDEYWIPGYQSAQASTPIPADGATKQSTDRDLIFLPGYQADQTKVYLGTDANSLNLITTRTNPDKNIVVAGQDFTLTADETYYWRVDTILADSTVITGDVWSFTVDPSINETELATSDTFVNAAQSTTVYGANNTLRLSGSNFLGYVKFDVAAPAGYEVASATLRLKADVIDIPDTSVYAITGSWDEATLTWATDNLVWGSLLDSTSPITANSTVDFDVSSAVTSNGTYTFGLQTSSTLAALKYVTKEGATAPELILTYQPISTAPVTLLGEDFEDQDLGDWTTTGTVTVIAAAASNSSWGARVKQTATLRKAISTVGYKDITISYDRKSKNMDAGEDFSIQWTTNAGSGSWIDIEVVTDENLTSQTFVLPVSAENNANFEIRFRTNADLTDERGDVDNIVITGVAM